MAPADLRRLLASMSTAELNDFAYHYSNAALKVGRRAVLLDMLAAKCDTGTLVRVGERFGFAETYAAAVRVAPTKASELSLLLSPLSERARSLSQPGLVDRIGLGSSPAPNVDLTIREIYLDYRTAPVGSLSVRAALYETASFVSTRLTTSFATGYAVGTALNHLWSTYAPESYSSASNLLGITVDWFMTRTASVLAGSTLDHMGARDIVQIGSFQRQVFYSGAFGNLGSSTPFYSGGGDFDVSSPWEEHEERFTCR